jgi:hypothetical protein
MLVLTPLVVVHLHVLLVFLVNLRLYSTLLLVFLVILDSSLQDPLHLALHVVQVFNQLVAVPLAALAVVQEHSAL